MKTSALIIAAALGLPAVSAPLSASAGTLPTVAVLDFSTQGLTSNWWGQWQPGVAISDLLTSNIVNLGKFDVLDRTHIDQTLGENHLDQTQDFDPATAVTSGRMVGARFLIIGNIVQFDHTGTSGAAVGGIIPGPIGGLVGGIKQDRVTLNVAVRVVDAQTGRIVQSFNNETTDVATSIGGGAFVGLAGGGYENSNFINSAMGHLVNEEAGKIATTLDPTKFSSGPAAPTLSGHVLEVDGGNVILDIGSSRGAAVGTFFNVVKIKHIKDPYSGKVLTVNETVGTIEIMSVSSDTSIARRATGTPAAGETVQSQ